MHKPSVSLSVLNAAIHSYIFYQLSLSTNASAVVAEDHLEEAATIALLEHTRPAPGREAAADAARAQGANTAGDPCLKDDAQLESWISI